MSSFQTLIDSTIHCNGLAYDSGELKPEFTDVSGNTRQYPYKGLISNVDGTVVVKPIHNFTGNNLPITVEAGVPVGCIFDRIIEAGTTVDLSNIYLIPDLGRIYGRGI